MPESFSQILNSDKPVLVDFHAEWCGPCKQMAPEIKRFADAHKETVRVLKVDIDKNPKITSELNIQGVPTLILYKKGKILWRQSGAMNAQQLEAVIKEKLPQRQEDTKKH